MTELFRVETTKLNTAERESAKWDVTFREAKNITLDRTWIFTDGSGTGWHSAMVVRPGSEQRRIAQPSKRRGAPGAELDGVILGLENVVPGEAVAFVSDCLWSAYYVNEWRQARNPDIRERVEKARSLFANAGLTSALFIYHSGHQQDKSDFSICNNIADRLCRRQATVNSVLPPFIPSHDYQKD